jgi:SulP family sulfate permease
MILMNHEVGAASSPTFEQWLAAEVGPQADVARLKSYLDLHEFKAGELLFHQGEPSDSVDLIVSGCIAVTIVDENSSRPVKLRRVTGHTIVGEMGFYRHAPRSTNVMAEAPTVVYRLSKESFDRMEQENATTAAAFHAFIIRVLSDRLEFANREIAALS